VRLRHRVALLVATGFLAASTPAAAAETTVECGVFHDYTAPDPGLGVDGSITFGVFGGTAEVIDANATITPPADSVLATFANGAPSCFSVTRDAGVITAIAIAPTGTISGSVVLVPDAFGPGQDAYVIANRLVAPVTAVEADPALEALIKTAADSGSTLSATLTVDVGTGFPTTFDVTTTVSGAVVLLLNGDVQVGDATLPSAVIDAAARDELSKAAELGVPATVVITGIGTPTQTGVDVQITLSVSFTAPSSTPSPTPAPARTAVPLPNTSFR
jgi:hypothetical protein